MANNNAPDITTDYNNSRINTVTNAPGVQLGPAQNQLLGLLGPLLEYKMAMERERRQPMGGMMGPMMGMGGPPIGLASERRYSDANPAASMQAPRQLMYTKMVGGPNMVAGRVAAQPWEAGAAFSGYAPPGYNPYPSSATFAGSQGAPVNGGYGPSPGIPSYGSGQSQLQALQGGGQPDPYPNGTGVAHAQFMMQNALQRSNAEYDARRKKEEEED